MLKFKKKKKSIKEVSYLNNPLRETVKMQNVAGRKEMGDIYIYIKSMLHIAHVKAGYSMCNFPPLACIYTPSARASPAISCTYILIPHRIPPNF